MQYIPIIRQKPRHLLTETLHAHLRQVAEAKDARRTSLEAWHGSFRTCLEVLFLEHNDGTLKKNEQWLEFH